MARSLELEMDLYFCKHNLGPTKSYISGVRAGIAAAQDLIVEGVQVLAPELIEYLEKMSENSVSLGDLIIEIQRSTGKSLGDGLFAEIEYPKETLPIHYVRGFAEAILVTFETLGEANKASIDTLLVDAVMREFFARLRQYMKYS